jgi:hypothetical protein
LVKPGAFIRIDNISIPIDSFFCLQWFIIKFHELVNNLFNNRGCRFRIDNNYWFWIDNGFRIDNDRFWINNWFRVDNNYDFFLRDFRNSKLCSYCLIC